MVEFDEVEFAPGIEGMRHLRQSRDALLAACEAGYSELWCASESGALELDSCKEVLQQMWAAIKLAKEGRT